MKTFFGVMLDIGACIFFGWVASEILNFIRPGDYSVFWLAVAIYVLNKFFIIAMYTPPIQRFRPDDRDDPIMKRR